MTAHVPIELSLAQAHSTAVEKANAWRGRCVNLFAQGEMIIAQALKAMEPDRKLPMLLSQKIDRLQKRTAGDENIESALDAFASLADLRNAVVHGDGQVFVGRAGEWLLELEGLDREGPISRRIRAVGSEKQCRQIKSAVDRLRSRLNSRSSDRGDTPSA
jgi:hypothetical protein